MMKNKKIVILDDHNIFLQGLKELFQKYDDISEIYITDNYTVAIEYLKNEIIDLVITDISMPEISGIEFIAEVKKILPHQKIMVLSMFENVESYEHLNGYLLKESTEEELLKAIRSIVDDNKDYFPIEENKEHNIGITPNVTLLTKKEKEVIRLILQEFTANEIALKLDLSKYTVETHKKNIFAKLEVSNIAGLAKKAIQLGIFK